jgi:hypothetical protein
LVAHIQEGTQAKGLENGVLGKIFGSKRDEEIDEWRKLHNEELYDLYCPSTIFRAIKPRRMRCIGHVAHMGERKGAYRLLVGYMREREKFYGIALRTLEIAAEQFFINHRGASLKVSCEKSLTTNSLQESNHGSSVKYCRTINILNVF